LTDRAAKMSTEKARHTSAAAGMTESATQQFSETHSGESRTTKWARLLLLFGLFFLICFGLGYATLNRYNPAQVEGTGDSARHYAIVTNAPQPFGMAEHVRGRLLVPYLAKPFYYLARNRIRSWDPAFFGLLVVNSFFCAATALVLVFIAAHLTGDSLTALLSGCLYLLNYAVTNFQLAGLVDSAEAFFLLAIVWALINDRWAWLLPLALLGATAKETFVPLAATVAIVWLAVEWKSRPRAWRIFWVAVMLVIGLATVTVLQSLTRGQMIWPWSLAGYLGASNNYLVSLWRCVSAHEMWYTFAWLLPLGVWNLKRLPKAWVLSALAAMLVALALGAYRDTFGSVARPMFNATGPLLSLSVAILLARFSAPLKQHR
jgi:Predicted membrane protein (DUF2079)